MRLRLRAVAVAVAAFSSSNRSSSLSLSYASRNCLRPLRIYRQDNKRRTCLITVSNIVLTCISTGYGRSDRVCHIETPLHFPNLSSNAMTTQRKTCMIRPEDGT